MVYELLADGFEEIEALAPADLLRRAGISVVTVSIGEGSVVTGAHGISVATDAHISDIEDCSDAEMLILPGGMPGTTNLNASEDVHKLIDSAVENGKRIAEIEEKIGISLGVEVIENKPINKTPFEVDITHTNKQLILELGKENGRKNFDIYISG